MKTIERYVALCRDETIEDCMSNNVLIFSSEVPDTPYVKVEIRVIEEEKLYSHERADKKDMEQIAKEIKEDLLPPHGRVVTEGIVKNIIDGKVRHLKVIP